LRSNVSRVVVVERRLKVDRLDGARSIGPDEHAPAPVHAGSSGGVDQRPVVCGGERRGAGRGVAADSVHDG
jgi:hypothetical protein